MNQIFSISQRNKSNISSQHKRTFFFIKKEMKNSELMIHTSLHLFIDWLHFLHSHNYTCWNSCFLYVPHHLALLQLYDRNVVVELHDKAEKQRDPLTQFLSFGISERMYCSMVLYEASTVGVHSKRRIQYYLCTGIFYIAYRSVTFISFLNLLEY